MSARAKVAPRREVQRIPRLDSLKNPLPRLPHQPAKTSKKAQRVPNARQCPNPNCHDKDVGEEDGQLVCRGCGTVVSDSNIVSEISFGETSAGAAVVQGSYVGADQSYARGAIASGLKSAGGMDSREITEANGRRYFNQLGSALRLPLSITDAAMQIFKLAAANNFIQGRVTKSVAAVCLYIACRRQDSNQVMLIDFSDILQINVFKLGHIYKALLEELRLNGNVFLVNAVNPEDLILRFAQRLEFGKETMRVANEAAHIVKRMNRDWMTTGRRPNGICGAALILAARMNNFRRTVREVVFIVKVTEVTIHKRLDEFKITESSALTVEQFRTIDLERACDPPAFYEQKDGKKNRHKRKARVLDEVEISDDESHRSPSAGPSNENNQLETPAATQQQQRQAQADSQAMPPPPIPIDPALLEDTPLGPSGKDSSHTLQSGSSTGPQASESPAKRKRGRPPGKGRKPTPPTASDLLDESTIESDISAVLSDPSTVAHASDLHQALEATETETTLSAQSLNPTEPALPRAPIPDTEIIPEEEFAGDPEIDDCLLTPDEIAVKERIWVHENADYLRAQQAKILKQQLAEANGTARKIIRRTRRRGRMGDMSAYREGGAEGREGGSIASSPAEATMKMLMKRAYSKKINYETLQKLYQPSPSGSKAASVAAADSIPGSSDMGGNRPGTPAGDKAPTPPVSITTDPAVARPAVEAEEGVEILGRVETPPPMDNDEVEEAYDYNVDDGEDDEMDDLVDEGADEELDDGGDDED